MQCNHLLFFFSSERATEPKELYVTLYNLLTTFGLGIVRAFWEKPGKLRIAIRRHLLKNVSQEVGILLSRLSWKLRLRHADKGHVVLWRRVNCDRTVCLAQRESEPTQTLLCARGGQPDSAILSRVREVTAWTMWVGSVLWLWCPEPPAETPGGPAA